MAKNDYHGVPVTDTIVDDLELDEGCVSDLNDQATQSLSAPGRAKQIDYHNGLLTTGDFIISTKDSGFSSRVSEVGGGESDLSGHSVLGKNKNLTKLLTRISQCQNSDGCKCDLQSVVKIVLKVLGVFLMLYIFICTLDLLSNAFRLLGGKTAGSVFQDSALLVNPITGLMIGILTTVILQSSSTSSSIVITMVASNIMDLQPAIPIIMGANIGTTVTNTLVSLAHSMNRKEFRRAFSAAVVHDVFNWLTVVVLLPLEYCTGYLYHLTKAIVNSLDMESLKAKNQDLLKVITKPLTSRIVEIDQDVITAIAEGKKDYADKPLLEVYCTFIKTEHLTLINQTIQDNSTGTESWIMVNKTIPRSIPLDKCKSLFSMIGWNDTPSGILLFVCSIITLSLCLFIMVKLLHSLLGGHIAKAARKIINADFPRPFHWVTGYAALVVGAGMTILVQSSSVFTSALTPLVGIGCLKLERMYPLTLGSNIGTTFTGILAALASSSSTMSVALQLAFCHLFFNISGILLFYPIPKARLIVLNTARYLGHTTAHYRWFAITYLIFMFLVFPGLFFAVSFAGKVVFILTVCILGLVVSFVAVINVMQRYLTLRRFLPVVLQTWDFLPESMRSLAPMDRCLGRAVAHFSQCCCQCCLKYCQRMQQVPDNDLDYVHSDSESSMQSSYLPFAAPSRITLPSQSGTDIKSSTSRIYKAREASSGKVNLKKSSCVKERVLDETVRSSA